MAPEELLDEIRKIVRDEMPFADAITGVDFEGPKIAFYCKNFNLLTRDGDAIKELARRIRKRVIFRPDQSILTEQGEAERRIRRLVPLEAGITNIFFSPDVGEVTIEAKKPGVVIGKEGALLREIMQRTNWTPKVVRAPPIRSEVLERVRMSLIQAGAKRQDILRRVGRRIYRGAGAKVDWVRVTALGGCREVGRSSFLLQTPKSRILLDCGINLASEARAFPHLEVPELRLQELDAVVITHAHLDHSGFVPYLFKYGYDGPVYCTPPTLDLSALLMLDYLEVAEREGKPTPYDKKDIRTMVQHCITLDYGDVTDISPDVRITLYNAGHILGSAIVHIHIGEGLHNIVYTGDLKFDRTRLFSPAIRTFPRLETLFIDSTYGGAEDIRPLRADAERELIRIITETTKRGGKVLIPAFAVGRAQEIMVLLEECRREGTLDGIPVYSEGMIWEAVGIHTAYPEYLSPNLRDMILHEGRNPFLSYTFDKVTSPDKRAEVIEGEPCVILSTAGMMSGGPVLEYFKALAGDPRNALVFVGYQSEGSLGRRIQRGWHEVPLVGADGRIEEVKVNMEVRTVEGFSGHSDRAQLINYVHRLTPRPQRIICCHGDENKCAELASALHKLFRVETKAPLNLEAIRLH